LRAKALEATLTSPPQPCRLEKLRDARKNAHKAPGRGNTDGCHVAERPLNLQGVCLAVTSGVDLSGFLGDGREGRVEAKFFCELGRRGALGFSKILRARSKWSAPRSLNSLPSLEHVYIVVIIGGCDLRKRLFFPCRGRCEPVELGFEVAVFLRVRPWQHWTRIV